MTPRFGASHFAPCPIVLKGLKHVLANAFAHPAGVEDNFALLSSILTIQVLTRFFIRVN
jgi:hypothetical protein